MEWWSRIDWRESNWVTGAIHVYAGVVFVFTLAVFFAHRSRLKGLARRVGSLTAQIEGRGAAPERVHLEQLGVLIMHLGEVVEHRKDIDIGPVLDFVRREERQLESGSVTMVNLTETMIELFPMLGILGTVWGISGVGQEDFSSERLLTLFGTAIGTTLWALFYAIVFRIAYSAFVHAKVVALVDYGQRFLDFLGILEKRSRTLAPGTSGIGNPWSEAPE